MLRRSLSQLATKKKWDTYADIGTNNIVMIGMGSIGRATLPLIERHFNFDPKKLTIYDPNPLNFFTFKDKPYTAKTTALTAQNYKQELDGLVKAGTVVVNLSVDVSSAAMIDYCRGRDALYIDTVVEPWKDGYDDHNAPSATRSNYVMREEVMALKRKYPAGPTAVTCCGANPGMVSWFLKDALLDIARDTGVTVPAPAGNGGKMLSRAQWAALAQELGVKGVHVAERDTQKTKVRRPENTFVNTWSCEGFIAEGFHQPAELGWGTHERWFPPTGRRHEGGCQAGIYLEQPGALTQVRSWCPTYGAQRGYLVTHNEAISISDYFTVPGASGDAAAPQYRPTCHYAYRMCEEAIMCCNEILSSGKIHPVKEVVLEDSIMPGGVDELGVLVFGHKKNAYWLGSKLSLEQAVELAPWQNPTALQVSSAALAGVVYALNNPKEGIIEADEMDHKQCLAVQKQYLGDVIGKYTDWTPLENNFVEKMYKPLREGKTDPTDPWQFKNVLVW